MDEVSAIVQGEKVTYPLEQAFAMLCGAGLATMTELLAYRGPWSFKLIALMIPRAVEMEAKAANMNFNATLAAVGTLVSKDAAQTWQAAMERTQRSVDAAVAEAGGEDKTKGNEQKVVDDFLKVATKLTGVPSKEKGPLGPTGPTRVSKK